MSANSTVTSADFARKAQEIFQQYNGKVTYKLGRTGPDECDCKGYVLWTLQMLGLDVNSAGTNTMIRTQMRSYCKLSNASQLSPGMVVFKARSDTSNLKNKFKNGGDSYNAAIGEIDVYHVGIVTQVSPKIVIRHCSTGGLMTDNSISKWSYCGYVKWVEKCESNAQTISNTKLLRVSAPSGNTVNLRKNTSAKSQLVERVPIGSIVQYCQSINGWTKIKYKKWSGWMMNGYLEAA